MSFYTAAGACIFYRNRLLLVQQAIGGPQSLKWAPPGGHGNENEDFESIAIREVKEETNLDIKIKGIAKCGVIVTPNGNIFGVVLYHATPLNPKEIKVDPKEVNDYRWVTKQDIQNEKYPLRDSFIKQMLLQAFSEKPSSLKVFEVVKSSENY
jgi:8-oxo-dGTP pyrophosphatase MutT (NUDIX family)